MIFMHWWLWQRLFLVAVVPTICVIIAFVLRRKPSKLARVVWLVACVLAVPLVTCAIGFYCVFFMFGGTPDIYKTEFSPNNKRAARIEIAAFGSTSVTLYEMHGFLTHQVFAENYADAEDIGWNGDNELKVYYRGHGNECISTSTVKVTCVQLPDYTKTGNSSSTGEPNTLR